MSLLKPEHPFFVGIEPVDTIIDIGPGIAPVQFFETKSAELAAERRSSRSTIPRHPADSFP